MRSSIYKFIGEQDIVRHRGYLIWSAIAKSRFPVRVASEDDIVILDKLDWEQKTYTVGDYYIGTFDLNKPTSRHYFMWIKDRIKNGWFGQEKIKYRWREGKQPIIYLEWVQYYTELVKNKGDTK